MTKFIGFKPEPEEYAAITAAIIMQSGKTGKRINNTEFLREACKQLSKKWSKK